jgi:hypothetical protein
MRMHADAPVVPATRLVLQLFTGGVLNPAG